MNGLPASDLCHTDLRLGNDLLSALFCSRSLYAFRDHDICSILIKDACAVHFLDHLSRSLALTEARKGDLLLILLISLLNRCIRTLLQIPRSSALPYSFPVFPPVHSLCPVPPLTVKRTGNPLCFLSIAAAFTADQPAKNSRSDSHSQKDCPYSYAVIEIV